MTTDPKLDLSRVSRSALEALGRVLIDAASDWWTEEERAVFARIRTEAAAEHDPHPALDGATTALYRRNQELTLELEKLSEGWSARGRDIGALQQRISELELGIDSAISKLAGRDTRIEELTAELERWKSAADQDLKASLETQTALATERAAREQDRKAWLAACAKPEDARDVKQLLKDALRLMQSERDTALERVKESDAIVSNQLRKLAEQHESLQADEAALASARDIVIRCLDEIDCDIYDDPCTLQLVAMGREWLTSHPEAKP